MSKKPRKPRSPAAPSSNLETCFTDVHKVWKKYGAASVTRSEAASTLGASSTSSTFHRRVFSITAFGLLEAEGQKLKVSSVFQTLKTAKPNTSAFKKAALEAVERPRTFRDLLAEFGSKLPPRDAIAGRLVSQKSFNEKPAEQAARALEESLRWAGVLDGNNNILPIRDEGTTPPGSRNEQDDDTVPDSKQPLAENLSTDVALSDGRTLRISYPRGLTKEDAQKASRVLDALAQ